MDLAKFYNRVYDWIIVFGPKLLIGLAVLLVGLWLIKLLLTAIKTRLQKRQLDSTAKPFIISMIGVGLRIFLVLAVMQILGLEMTIFTALVGAFGVAAGLALSGTLQNFASGIIILLVKPFVVGDNIITQGQEGTVTSIHDFYTFITTFDNRSVIVPNSKLSNEVIINLSREGTRRLDIELKFPNSIDVEVIKNSINNSINKCKNILATPERRIGVASLDGDTYKIGINVWVDAHGFQDTRLAVQETILQDIKNSNINIPGL